MPQRRLPPARAGRAGSRPFKDDALLKIIREYTREAGVRNLERKIGAVCRKVGTRIAEGKLKTVKITPDLDGAIPEIKTNVWPAFPTDLISIAITVATQATGSIMFHDWMFSGRMYFTDKLVGMGAKIILCDPYRCLIQGPNQLYGENLESPDIRAGMSMLIAALGLLINERSGVLNLGAEGLMALGAVAGFAASRKARRSWICRRFWGLRPAVSKKMRSRSA